MNTYPELIDMHMHTVASDGTDTPEELLNAIRKAGIGMFSVTDHDAVKSCVELNALLGEDDPFFVNGVELSCKDAQGKYHILGYAYDLNAAPILDLVAYTHDLRMKKVHKRLAALKDNYQISFPDEEVEKLLSLNNPGKPHIGNLMVKYGYVENRSEAIEKYLNQIKIKGSDAIDPKDAIEAICKSGGIAVLAHPIYGNGNQLLDESELVRRIDALMRYGLRGLECYYSGFSPKEEKLMLSLADRFDLLVSAGSDYHGKNKLIMLGDTNLENTADANTHLHRLLDELMRLCGAKASSSQ